MPCCFSAENRKRSIFNKKAYADLQRSERYADRAGQVMTDDFANLRYRYPDKASELKWAEDKIQNFSGPGL